MALWTTPPPALALESATAEATASSVTPEARSRTGSTLTWNSTGVPPALATSATPGTEASWGRIEKSCRARSRPRSSPPPSTVYQKIWPVAAASGARRGTTPAGSPAPASDSRSPRARRASRKPTESSKITASQAYPKSLDARTTRTPRTPWSPTESGYVIWSSTSRGQCPGQSA